MVQNGSIASVRNAEKGFPQTSVHLLRSPAGSHFQHLCSRSLARTGHVATPKPRETGKYRLTPHYLNKIRVLLVRKESLGVSRDEQSLPQDLVQEASAQLRLVAVAVAVVVVRDVSTKMGL